MGIEVGGSKAYAVYNHGDIATAFHWINGEPAMVLFPTRKRINGAGAFVIPLDSAHRYVHPSGNPNLEYMIPTAAKAAAHMGFLHTDKFIIRKIIDAVCDDLPVLIGMPPEPRSLVEQAVQENIGEMSITVDGERIMERDIQMPTAEEMDGVTLQ